MIIAIDGPAASGKGTLGKRLAAHYGLRHLDTGLIYRAVAKALIDAGHALSDSDRALAAATALDPARFDEKVLKGHAIGEAASIVSAIPQVRAALRGFQQDFAAAPPGAVLDGRDIGSVVFPNADIKFFLTAKPEARARRRFEEDLAKGLATSYEQTFAEIKERDERDVSRADSPLTISEDAVVIDTSELDLSEVFAQMMQIIEERSAKATTNLT
jgi:cytidylate kinase